MDYTKQYLISAVIIRLFDIIGAAGSAAASPIRIKTKSFLAGDLYSAKINIDDSSKENVIIFYTENEDAKFFASKMNNEEKPNEGIWFFVVCGDSSGESYENNKMFFSSGEVLYEAGCNTAMKFVLGFEEMVDKFSAVVASKNTPTKEHIEIFKKFINTIEIKVEES